MEINHIELHVNQNGLQNVTVNHLIMLLRVLSKVFFTWFEEEFQLKSSSLRKRNQND